MHVWGVEQDCERIKIQMKESGEDREKPKNSGEDSCVDPWKTNGIVVVEMMMK